MTDYEGFKLRDLKQKRTKLQEQAQAIIDKATNAGRDFTSAEELEFERVLAEFREVNVAIEAKQKDDDGGPDPDSLDDPEDGSGRNMGRGGGNRGGGAGRGPTFVDSHGRRLRGLLPNESAARLWNDDGTEARGGREIEPGAVGRAVMYGATGRDEFLTQWERDHRDQVIKLGPSGGFMLSEELSRQLIDKIRATLILSRAGAISFPLTTHETRLVSIEEDPQAEWHEELETLSSTDVTLGSLSMVPSTLASLVKLSQELVDDSAQAAAEQVEQVMSASIAAELDRRLFVGGLELPGGILSFGLADNPDLNTVDAGGTAPSDYADVLDAIQFVEEANIMPSVRIDSPRTKRQYAGLTEDTSGQPLRAPDDVANLRHLVSTTVPTDLGTGSDESLSIVGEFGMTGAMVLLGIRQEFRVATTDVGAEMFERIGLAIRVHGRFDMAVARPAGLTRVEAIGPSA